jgi:hypothetical protein
MGIEVKNEEVLISLSDEASNYFKKIDYGKLIEYEFTKEIQSINKVSTTTTQNHLDKTPQKKTQKLRSKILSSIRKKDNFEDMIIVGGVNTLTLILDEKNEDFRFLMHLRSEDQGYAQETSHAVPAGELQPLNNAQNFKIDTNILWTILREYAEEIGGFDEFNGDENEKFEYEDNLPFNEYLNEIKENNFKIYYLGFGLDPLSL